MAFDPSQATNPRWSRHGAEVLVRWDSAAPAGTVFQVYVCGELAYSGRSRHCLVAPPQSYCTVDVGAVGPGEGLTDFSASLPAPPGSGRRPVLAWQGGTYLSDALVGFRVYRGATPGAAVDDSAPVATLTAYEAGVVTDGAGMGGAGTGGAGAAAGAYAWTGPALGDGTWNFGVTAYDAAGDEGAAAAFAVTVSNPPRAPARDPTTGLRLAGRYDAGTGVLTLSWLPSPP